MRAMRWMRGIVRCIGAIDQNITTFFAAILNTEKAPGTKLTTQTVTHSMCEVSRIKFPQIIARVTSKERLLFEGGLYYSRKYVSPTRYKWSYM